MSERHLGKVGLFVAVGLGLIAVLLLGFSKGLSFFTPTFSVQLKAASVGGLKKNANVLLSGVPVGRVEGFEVAPDGKGVLIDLHIEEKYRDRIHSDARFGIEQLGLLGDQYIEITPQENKAPALKQGEIVAAAEPMSIQETARSAKDLIALASKTLTGFNTILERIDRTVMSEQALTNIAGALDKFRVVADRASGMVDNINGLVVTNSPAIATSVSNLVQFSRDMEKLAAEMNAIVSTNRLELNAGVKSLNSTANLLQRLADDVQKGQGAVGLMLKDMEFRQNLSSAVSNFHVFSDNLNKHGLLRNLFFKPKPPKTEKK